jgi:ABC-type polysaccharide/polyol phosphate export permease
MCPRRPTMLCEWAKTGRRMEQERLLFSVTIADVMETRVSGYTSDSGIEQNGRRRNYVYLTLVMAVTDFKVKYDNSVLGYMWSLLKPLLMFGTLYMVFAVFVRWEVENYRLHLLLGIILWNFFSEVTLNSMVLLDGKASILKKIYFPRWIVVIASSLTSLLTLMLNIGVFFIFFFAAGARLGGGSVHLVLFLVELYLLSVGMAFLLCGIFPRFRDAHHIWEVFVQLGFWATPIVYPIAIVSEKYHHLIFLNPAARIVQGCRESLIGPGTEFLSLANHGIVLLVAVSLFAVGLAVFNGMSHSFAEDL